MLNKLMKEVHQNAIEHGWWDEERSFGDIVALCHSELSEALEEHRNKRKPGEIYYSGNGYEATSITGKGEHKRLGGRSIEREISNIADRAQLGKAVYPHLLRHSIATHLLAAGMALHNVQALLGHSDPKTTQIYAETSIENVVYEYKRIS